MFVRGQARISDDSGEDLEKWKVLVRGLTSYELDDERRVRGMSEIQRRQPKEGGCLCPKREWQGGKQSRTLWLCDRVVFVLWALVW